MAKQAGEGEEMTRRCPLGTSAFAPPRFVNRRSCRSKTREPSAHQRYDRRPCLPGTSSGLSAGSPADPIEAPSPPVQPQGDKEADRRAPVPEQVGVLLGRLTDVAAHPRLHLLAASVGAAASWVTLLVFLTQLIGWPALLLVGGGLPLAGVALRQRGRLWRALYAGPLGALTAGVILDSAEPVLRSPGLQPLTDPLLTGFIGFLLFVALLWVLLWPVTWILRALQRTQRNRSPRRLSRLGGD